MGQAQPVSYSLQITNDLIDTNGVTGDILHIVNNNLNDHYATAGSAYDGTAVAIPIELAPIHEVNTTLDLTALNVYNQITYDGALENLSGYRSQHGSADRFITRLKLVL